MITSSIRKIRVVRSSALSSTLRHHRNTAIKSISSHALSSTSAITSTCNTIYTIKTHDEALKSTTSLRTNDPIQKRSLSSYPPHTLYPMPALSPTMDSGTISKWNLAEGSSFAAGDVICEIETDKATVDFEAQDDGILAKILRDGGGGEEISVGVPICVVVEEEDDVGKFGDFVVDAEGGDDAGASADAEPAIAAAAAPVSNAEAPEREVSDEFILTPAARHMSQSKNLDATVLNGTGKGGRVTKGDVIIALRDGVQMPPWKSEAASSTVAPPASPATVEKAAPTTATAPTTTTSNTVQIPSITTSGTYTDILNNNMRKVIAKRLTQSKSTVPHFYSTVEVELDALLALRKKLLQEHDVKVSVNDIILKASAMALRDVPEVNSALKNPNSTEKVTVSPTVDISVAVATPTGLITPIVPDTDKLGLAEISSAIKDLATRAREGKLSPEEYQGGSFCISNLGMFGINEFSAVINPPQAAILAVGGGVQRVLVNSPYVEGEEGEKVRPRVRSVMTARLSADRRVVDEATVGLFLSSLRCYLNRPELLLL